jgi:hypothetical protein
MLTTIGWRGSKAPPGFSLASLRKIPGMVDLFVAKYSLIQLQLEFIAILRYGVFVFCFVSIRLHHRL